MSTYYSSRTHSSYLSYDSPYLFLSQRFHSLLFPNPIISQPVLIQQTTNHQKNALHKRHNHNPQPQPRHNNQWRPPHPQPKNHRNRQNPGPPRPLPQRTRHRPHRPHHHPRPNQHPHAHSADSHPRRRRRPRTRLLALRTHLALTRKLHRGRRLLRGETEYCRDVKVRDDVFSGEYVCGSVWV